MSIFKRILCISLVVILVLSVTSCDTIGEDLLEELAVYLENLAETVDENINFPSPEEDKFGNQYWPDIPEDDTDDDWDDEYHEHTIVSIPEVAPTCTEDGLTEGLQCKECGLILTSQTTVPATGHDMGAWIIDEYADWGVKGRKHSECNNCGETVVEEFECSKNLDYFFNTDGTYYVRGIGACTDTDIVIPLTYDGRRVTKIGNSAFSSNENITSVIIPYGVTDIDAYAFSWCSNLSYASIPETVVYIGSSAFWYCFELTSATIPAGVSYVGDGAFGCTGIKSVEDLGLDPDNRYYSTRGNCLIAEYNGTLVMGFGNSVIPNDGTVVQIATQAFAGCGDLTEITIPGSVKTIGASAFYCCGSLESITFNEGLEIIGYNAFNACGSLTDIALPNSVKKIESSAFTWCTGLKSIVIGSGLERIEGDAFYECRGITKIYYVGSESDWHNISKGAGWDSGLGSVKMIYNYEG